MADRRHRPRVTYPFAATVDVAPKRTPWWAWAIAALIITGSVVAASCIMVLLVYLTATTVF